MRYFYTIYLEDVHHVRALDDDCWLVLEKAVVMQGPMERICGSTRQGRQSFDPGGLLAWPPSQDRFLGVPQGHGSGDSRGR